MPRLLDRVCRRAQPGRIGKLDRPASERGLEGDNISGCARRRVDDRAVKTAKRVEQAALTHVGTPRDDNFPSGKQPQPDGPALDEGVQTAPARARASVSTRSASRAISARRAPWAWSSKISAVCTVGALERSCQRLRGELVTAWVVEARKLPSFAALCPGCVRAPLAPVKRPPSHHDTEARWPESRFPGPRRPLRLPARPRSAPAATGRASAVKPDSAAGTEHLVDEIDRPRSPDPHDRDGASGRRPSTSRRKLYFPSERPVILRTRLRTPSFT